MYASCRALPPLETDARFVPKMQSEVPDVEILVNPYFTNPNMVITPETNASSKQWYQCQRAYQKAVPTPHPNYNMNHFAIFLSSNSSVRSK